MTKTVRKTVLLPPDLARAVEQMARMPDLTPEVFGETLRSLAGFARSL